MASTAAFSVGSSSASSNRYNRRVSRRKSFRRFLQKRLSLNHSSGDWIDDGIVCHKPPELQTLCEMTKFSRRELQLIYRGFKQGCPSGTLTPEKFREILAQLFPLGDPTIYASMLFKTFDKDKEGQVNFEEFVRCLSLLSHGSTEEKLNWVFSLYDINSDGELTKDELKRVVSGIYDLMGKNTDPPYSECTVQEHVDFVFSRFSKGDRITLNSFLETCRKEESISASFEVLGTVL